MSKWHFSVGASYMAASPMESKQNSRFFFLFGNKDMNILKHFQTFLDKKNIDCLSSFNFKFF